MSEEEGNDRFEDIDADKDDKVTWQEYLRDTYNMESEDEKRDPFQSPHADEEDKLIADDRRMFDAADLNKDGSLQPKEFVAFLSPEEFAHMLPIILEQTLRDKDNNKDGKIDFQEFIGDSGANHDKEWLLSEKEKFDSDYDRDGDGSLNGNEILSWVVPSNEYVISRYGLVIGQHAQQIFFLYYSEVATDEVDHLFGASDDNHDDRLSYKEIIDNYDTFVGSEGW